MRNETKHKKLKGSRFWVLTMRIAAAIACFTVVSAYMLSGVYASFSSAASGTDRANVAKFHVEMTADTTSDTVTLDGGTAVNNLVQGTYSFSVSGSSEVAVDYDIEIRFTVAPPVGVSFQIDDQTVQSADGSKTSFYFDGCRIAPNDTSAQAHALKIVSDIDALEEEFSDTVTVCIVAVQVD